MRLEENVNKSWADIDVLLKQRYDMIPNLVNTVKGYASHEREIFEQITSYSPNRRRLLCSGDVKGLVRQKEQLLPLCLESTWLLSNTPN